MKDLWKHLSAAVRRAASLLLAAALVLCCVPSALAVGTAATGQTVRIGYIDYPGFIDAQPDGTYKGYGIDLLNKLATHTGWSYEYVYDTWPNQLQNLKDGTIDFLCHAQSTDTRRQDYLFSRYSTGSETSVLYARSSDTRFYYDDYTHFNGMTVGLLRDSFQNEQFEAYAAQYGFTYTPVYFDTSAEVLTALESGGIDSAAMGSLFNLAGYKVLCRFGSDPFYLISGKQNADLMTAADNALSELFAEDPYFEASLYRTYYGASAASSGLLYTRQESDYIKTADVITVGLLPNRSPLSYQTSSGEAAGMTVDLMELIAEKSGLKFKYEFLDIGETGMAYLADTGGSLVAGVMSSEFSKLNSALLQSEDLMEGSVAFVGKNGMKFSADSALTVALPAGFIGGESVVATVYPNFTYYHGTSNEDCLEAIRDGKADVMLQNLYIARECLQSPRYSGLEVFPAYTFPESMKVVALPRDAMLMSLIDKTIDSFTEDEVNNIVLSNTVGKAYHVSSSDFFYQYRFAIMGIAVMAMAVFVLLAVLLAVRQRSNSHLALANAKLEKANLQLSDAVEQAEKANHAKSQFLSRMSHEIRTPMNAIVGITTIARQYEHEPEKVDDYLTKIDSASRVLLSIINDVLDMSAIESDKLKIASAEFDIKQVLNNLATVYYPQCRAKGIDLIMGTDLESEMLVGDSLRVNQILMNLVSNAYKFTDKGGRISVNVTETRRQDDKVYLRFVVADRGVGMTPDMLTRLFKPFEQESATTAQKHGGSGLGMSITKNLVDMMRGAIRVESEKGKGTTFTVDLPFRATGRAVEPETGHLRNIRALVVDDDDAAAEYTSVVLKRIGVYYDVAHSGKEAVQKAVDEHQRGSGYDICFVDWKMPEMDGGAVTRQLRQIFDRDTMIIIVSAYDLAEVEDEAKAAGADLFVTKPLFQSTVFNLLMNLSGGRYTKETAEATDFDFTGHRVLLAEDNALNREIAVELLHMVQMEADCAENGQQALEQFTAAAPGTYDAILMDVQMPLMDGFEATKAIRTSAHPEAKTIPIFAMTANAFAEDVSASLNAGMNGHIAKPIDTDVLYRTLAGVIKKQKETALQP